MRICGLSRDTPDLPDPDPDGIPCCIGKAMFGADRCTCWQPVYDVEQLPLVDAAPNQRTSMCGDCAFQNGSPERSGDEGYVNSGAGELAALVASGQPFWCHQGLRRPVRWRHPSGVEVPGHPGNYRPVIIDGVPHKADGTPADLCAGWAARRRAFEAGQRGG